MSVPAQAVGIDVGGTNLRAARIDAAGRLDGLVRARIDAPSADAVIERIVALAAPLVDDAVVAVGVGIPGRLSLGGEVVLSAGFLELAGVRLAGRLEARLARPVVVDNDANVAALAELVHGAGRGCDDFLLVTLGTGVGGGVVVNGNVLRGAHGFAAEILRRHGMRIGHEADRRILSPSQARELCGKVLDRVAFPSFEIPSQDSIVKQVLALAEQAANHLVEPEQIIALNEGLLGRTTSRVDAEVLRHRIDLAQGLRAYRDLKDEYRVIDFGDQIRLALRVVREHPDVVAEYRERFPAVLLDEYQDTNVAQADLLEPRFEGPREVEDPAHLRLELVHLDEHVLQVLAQAVALAAREQGRCADSNVLHDAFLLGNARNRLPAHRDRKCIGTPGPQLGFGHVD